MPTQHSIPLALIPGFMLDESLWDELVALFPGDRKIIGPIYSLGKIFPKLLRRLLISRQRVLLWLDSSEEVSRRAEQEEIKKAKETASLWPCLAGLFGRDYCATGTN